MRITFLFFPLFFFFIACQTKPEQISLEVSPDTPEIFGEGFISTPFYERDIAINKNGDEIIYTMGDYKQHRRFLVISSKKGEQWSTPEVLSISGQYQDIEPFLSPDGKRLYFASDRPIYGNPERKDYNIWYSEREGETWQEPLPLDSIINTTADEYYPAVSNDYHLYFTATREDGIGSEDIFRSTYEEGKYLPPNPLDSAINTKTYEFNAYISPAEDLIVFSSYGRRDGHGGGDLYYSSRNKDGKWSASENLGPAINSSALDFCPFIDWERNTFYFSSERMPGFEGRVISIDSLKKRGNSAENGFGNIYRVKLAGLNLN